MWKRLVCLIWRTSLWLFNSKSMHFVWENLGPGEKLLTKPKPICIPHFVQDLFPTGINEELWDLSWTSGTESDVFPCYMNLRANQRLNSCEHFSEWEFVSQDASNHIVWASASAAVFIFITFITWNFHYMIQEHFIWLNSLVGIFVTCCLAKMGYKRCLKWGHLISNELFIGGYN